MDLKAFRAQALKELGGPAKTVAAARKRVTNLEAARADLQNTIGAKLDAVAAVEADLEAARAELGAALRDLKHAGHDLYQRVAQQLNMETYAAQQKAQQEILVAASTGFQTTLAELRGELGPDCCLEPFGW
jgi:predicted  nucleic acid-binding Zn-ribbon protein